MYAVLHVLFPIIVILYLLDCVILVKKNQVVFYSIVGNHFWLKQSGLFIVKIFPTSEVINAIKPPLIFTQRGLHFISKDVKEENRLRPFKYVAFEDINTVEMRENKIIINNSVIASYPNNIAAKKLSIFIKSMLNLNQRSRVEKIQEISNKSTNTKEILRIRHHNKNSLYFLDLCVSLFFAFLFIVVPLTIYTELQLYLTPLAIVIPLSILYLAILTLTVISAKGLLGLERGKNLLMTFIAILSPISSLHVTKELTKNTLYEFDYLAIAAILLPTDEFKFLMREELLGIYEAQNIYNEPEQQEFWKAREIRSVNVLAQKGITIRELFRSPPKKDTNADRYCPLCLAEYKKVAKQCSSCGILLKTYKEQKFE
jgi:hypothetical protein